MAIRDITSISSGALYAIAWWIWIDGNIYQVMNNYTPTVYWYYYLPAIASTLGLIMTNILDLSYLNPVSWVYDSSISAQARAWLFVSFMVSFSGIIVSVWIMSATFLPPHNTNPDSEWPGVAMTIQNIIILVCSFILLFGKSKRNDYEDFG